MVATCIKLVIFFVTNCMLHKTCSPCQASAGKLQYIGMERTLVKDSVNRIDETIILKGWVDSIRDHGKITFMDLRDRSGIIQCVGQNLEKVTPESVVEITGKIVARPEKLINPNIVTGTVELQIEKLEVISLSSELPIPLNTDGYEINEEIRNKYRYLDIRRPRMTKNLRLRSKVTQFLRNYLNDQDFVEVETPILTKTTPEGARDFLVPSRLQPGSFYALPQSPQQYKQLLMVAGMERYFQFARCFRDEDPRRDRAYGEFTQLDMEMSFVTQEEILQITEKMFSTLITELFPEKKIQETPWPRISHKEAKEKYGNDKPDLRKDKNDPNLLAFCWVLDFPLFTEQSKDDFFHGSGAAKWAPSHHMFTSPHPDDMELLDSDPGKVRGLQHDFVLNGFEVGGGSIRIHDPKIQEKVFKLIGFSDAQRDQFDHMLTAFSFGVPPHGGIAPGLDRFLMVALGEPSVREVMAYPTSASGQTAVLNAPSKADDNQLKELGIKVAK
jgi:aspartyl-tRNA synthetase